MITRLKNSFPNHNIVSESSKELFVVDYKSINKGPVVILNIKPLEPHVFLNNGNSIPVFFDGFPDNAFIISPGNHCKQCECLIFPQSCNLTDWILVIETKYTHNIEIAFKQNTDYPNCMIDQIISTVSFLRNQGVILKDKTVNAIVSFPTLIDDFSAFFFTRTILSIEDILITHKIKIRATNSAIIKNDRKIQI